MITVHINFPAAEKSRIDSGGVMFSRTYATMRLPKQVIVLCSPKVGDAVIEALKHRAKLLRQERLTVNLRLDENEIKPTQTNALILPSFLWPAVHRVLDSIIIRATFGTPAAEVIKEMEQDVQEFSLLSVSLADKLAALTASILFWRASKLEQEREREEAAAQTLVPLDQAFDALKQALEMT